MMVDENIGETGAYPDTGNGNCRELIDVLMAQGVDTIVLSPGSRNAPLLIAASARSRLRKVIINDERAAAFTALGISMVSRKPVAIACTSGTALYNYSPAIAEAYYQRLPLIVITADRPAQWIDQDDSQTLHQFEALDKIVKRSYDIYEETGMTAKCRNGEFENELKWHVNRVANEAILTAISGHPGPVHINIQFGTPLNNVCEYIPRQPRTVKLISGGMGASREFASATARELLGKRIMVVAGFMAPDNRLNRALSSFARLGNVTVMAETISNLHLAEGTTMIDSVLTRLSQEERERLRPDVVISIGGSLVSRFLKEYIRESGRTEHWTLGDTDIAVDCFQHLTRHYDMLPQEFFRSVSGAAHSLLRREAAECTHPDYNASWEKARDLASAVNDDIIRNSGWSELTALDETFRQVPASWNVFLSNGTPIRYAQILIKRLPHANYCNRGVSGIDGTNATALGTAMAYDGDTLLVTGDVSFSYFPEVLNYYPLAPRLRIILINNRGGGIFRFVGTTRELDSREEYFCSPPGIPFGKIATAYGWKYICVTDMEGLRNALVTIRKETHVFIEIEVDPEKSAQALVSYMRTQAPEFPACKETDNQK